MHRSKFFAVVVLSFLLISPISFGENQNTYLPALLQLHIGQAQFFLNKTTVEKASLVYDENKNYQRLDITLKPDAEKKFSALTEKNIGKLLTVTFNQKIISHATIQSSLGANFQVMGITEQEAKLFLQGLQH